MVILASADPEARESHTKAGSKLLVQSSAERLKSRDGLKQSRLNVYANLLGAGVRDILQYNSWYHKKAGHAHMRHHNNLFELSRCTSGASRSATARRKSFSIAKHPGHAPVAGKVFGATAYKKPCSRYEKPKNRFLAVGACPECFAIHQVKWR